MMPTFQPCSKFWEKNPPLEHSGRASQTDRREIDHISRAYYVTFGQQLQRRLYVTLYI